MNNINTINTIDRTKCQWAWVGDSEEKAASKQKKRLVYGIDPFGRYSTAQHGEEEKFRNNEPFMNTSWKYAEFIPEPKTKTVPMTFEDILCMEVQNVWIPVFRTISDDYDISVNFSSGWCIEDHEYTFFNKKTKTYGEWMPLTKEVECE